MTTIEEYLVRRKDIKPLFNMESEYVSTEGIFLFRANIDNRFAGAWSTTIALAITSLTNVLIAAGEIE
jgi:hypothetical protein